MGKVTINHLLKQCSNFLECSPSKCLFFGDRDVDREFAEFAGMNFYTDDKYDGS